MKTAKYYLKIWTILTKNSFLGVLSQRSVFVIFMIGKLFRFGFYLLFITFLLQGTNSLAGYSLNQTLFFFLTFMLVDTIAQLFFREVYRFRPLVVSGGFDLVLTKPFSSLSRSLFGGADVMDLATLPIILVILFAIGGQLSPSLISIIFYIALIFNALIVAAAFHIFVLGLGIITLEVDHAIMIYRDIVSLGRFPVDIYKQPIKNVLTFLVPVAIMATFPAKAFMGLLSFQGLLISFAIACILLFLSLRFWRFALAFYTSASS